MNPNVDVNPSDNTEAEGDEILDQASGGKGFQTNGFNLGN